VLGKVNMDGSIGYRSIGFARAESGITLFEEMEVKSFGFGDPNSTSGDLIPSIEIPQVTGESMESGDYFGEVTFTGGHEQTIVAVNNGDIDAGVTWADGQGNWEDGYNSGALRKAVDAGLVDGLHERDPDCPYGVAAGETLGFQPVSHDTCLSVIAARKSKIGG